MDYQKLFQNENADAIEQLKKTSAKKRRKMIVWGTIIAVCCSAIYYILGARPIGTTDGILSIMFALMVGGFCGLSIFMIFSTQAKVPKELNEAARKIVFEKILPTLILLLKKKYVFVSDIEQQLYTIAKGKKSWIRASTGRLIDYQDMQDNDNLIIMENKDTNDYLIEDQVKYRLIAWGVNDGKINIVRIQITPTIKTIEEIIEWRDYRIKRKPARIRAGFHFI